MSDTEKLKYRQVVGADPAAPPVRSDPINVAFKRDMLIDITSWAISALTVAVHPHFSALTLQRYSWDAETLTEVGYDGLESIDDMRALVDHTATRLKVQAFTGMVEQLLEAKNRKYGLQKMLGFWVNKDKQRVQFDALRAFLTDTTSAGPKRANPPRKIQITGSRRGTVQVDAGGFGLERIPSTLALYNIDSLDAPKNLLTKVPDAALLCWSTLTYLNLSNNRIEIIPSAILGLHLLKELDVSSNRLTYVSPNVIFLQNLAELDVSDNKMLTGELGDPIVPYTVDATLYSQGTGITQTSSFYKMFSQHGLVV